jgi:Zn-dependent peptidase ImmA (M78 family)/transcriptional regulator with XRE-family HTH domain
MDQSNVVDLWSRFGGDGQSRRVFPERIREARLAEGLYQRELAESLGVTKQSVSQWEQGSKKPDGAALFKMAQRLKQPVSYFTKERPNVFGRSTTAFYRAFGPKTKKRNEQCEVWKEWLVQTTALFSSAVKLPPPVIPEKDGSSEDGSYTADEIEVAATECRRLWGLGDGPIANMVNLLESRGVILTKVHFGAEQVNAFSFWNGDKPFIFLSSGQGAFCARARFDAAHELGHLILHRGISSEDLEEPSVLKRVEREADRFAGAFLLPESTYPNEVFTTRVESFIELKRRWKTSIQAQIYRCEDLGIFSELQILNMRKTVSKNGWRTIEPFDRELELERPTLLRKSLHLMVSSGSVPRSAIPDGVNLNPAVVAAFCGEDARFFEDQQKIPEPILR